MFSHAFGTLEAGSQHDEVSHVLRRLAQAHPSVLTPLLNFPDFFARASSVHALSQFFVNVLSSLFM